MLLSSCCLLFVMHTQPTCSWQRGEKDSAAFGVCVCMYRCWMGDFEDAARMQHAIVVEFKRAQNSILRGSCP